MMAKINPLDNYKTREPKYLVLLAYLENCFDAQYGRKNLLERCRTLCGYKVNGFSNAYNDLHEMGYIVHFGNGICGLGEYEKNNEWEHVVEKLGECVGKKINFNEFFSALEESIEIKKSVEISA